MPGEYSRVNVKRRRYVDMVTTILKEEGVYKPDMSESLFTTINIRISANMAKGLTIRQCVDDIYITMFNRSA